MKKSIPGISLMSAFDDCVLKYQEQFIRCRQETSEDAVHDLRVSIRRLLALVDVLRTVFPTLPRCRGLRRRLKTQLDSLSTLRDTQVMLKAVRTWPMRRAGQAFAAWLQQQEQVQLETAASSLRAFRKDKVERRLGKLRHKLEAVLEIDGDWQQAVQQVPADAFARVMARHRQVMQNDVRGIHRVRVAFKRFRYTVEVIQAVVSLKDPEYLKALREWQTLLGDLQDAVVMSAILAVFAASHHEFDALPLVKQAARRREQCLQDYWQRRGDLASVWLPVD